MELLAEKFVRIFVRIHQVIRDQLLASEAEIIQSKAFFAHFYVKSHAVKYLLVLLCSVFVFL